MKKHLFRFYRWAQRRLAPGLRYSQHHYHATLGAFLVRGAQWLDLGCGHQLFASWMLKQEQELAARAGRFTGLDPDIGSMRKHQTLQDRVAGEVEQLPFTRQCFDIVTANMAMEHMEKPAFALKEIYRVLRPGGLFVFHTPNIRNPKIWLAFHTPEWIKKRLIVFLEGRVEEDVYQTFYRLNTGEDVERLAAASGFRVEKLQFVSTAAATVMLGPIVILELLWLRLIGRERFKHYRSNIIAVLRKQPETL